jgi:hypothetical protein
MISRKVSSVRFAGGSVEPSACFVARTNTRKTKRALIWSGSEAAADLELGWKLRNELSSPTRATDSELFV